MDSYDAIIYGNDIHSLITALLILKKEKRVLLVNQNDRVGNFTEYYQRRRFTFNNIYNTLSFASEDKENQIIDIMICVNDGENNIRKGIVCSNKYGHQTYLKPYYMDHLQLVK